MTHDLLVLGAGAGGLSAARAGIRAGWTTALVTDGPIGGDCTFTGCVPSKTLLAAAAALTLGAVMMANAQVISETAYAADHDHLTGAPSRRAFFAAAERELSTLRAKREVQP